MFGSQFDEHPFHADQFFAIDIGHIISVAGEAVVVVDAAVGDSHVEVGHIGVDRHAMIGKAWPQPDTVTQQGCPLGFRQAATGRHIARFVFETRTAASITANALVAFRIGDGLYRLGKGNG